MKRPCQGWFRVHHVPELLAGHSLCKVEWILQAVTGTISPRDEQWRATYKQRNRVDQLSVRWHYKLSNASFLLHEGFKD
ncbi:hypothetical protein SCLCIDRAFT_1207079, partial [Scleroderma citrinum Foug A]